MYTLMRLMFGGIHSCTKESPKGSIGEAEVQVLLQVAEPPKKQMKGGEHDERRKTGT